MATDFLANLKTYIDRIENNLTLKKDYSEELKELDGLRSDAMVVRTESVDGHKANDLLARISQIEDWIYGEIKYNEAKNLSNTKDLAKNESSNEAFSPPEKAENNNIITKFLTEIQKIAQSIVQGLIKWGKLYETKDNHSVVFVGYDEKNQPKSWQKYDLNGQKVENSENKSNPFYNFALLGKPESFRLCVFENPIDLLKQATAEKNSGEDWTKAHRMALFDVSDDRSMNSVKRFLDDNPQINQVEFWSPKDKLMHERFSEAFNRNSDKFSNIEVKFKEMNEDLSEPKERENTQVNDKDLNVSENNNDYGDELER